MRYLADIHSAAYREDAEIKYAFENGSLRMANHPMPLSIKEDEFKFLRDYIIKHDLKRGYEVATAFGVSTMACGLGFKETGGKLVTMDAYIEEQYDSCTDYRADKATYQDADGWKSVNFLIEHYGLQDVVTPTVGGSPEDTRSRLSTVFDLEKDKLDFVFIDALHYDEAVIADLESIRDLLADKYVLFLHDVHCFGSDVVNHLLNNFGQTWTTPPSCRYIAGSQNGGYNLSYISHV